MTIPTVMLLFPIFSQGLAALCTASGRTNALSGTCTTCKEGCVCEDSYGLATGYAPQGYLCKAFGPNNCLSAELCDVAAGPTGPPVDVAITLLGGPANGCHNGINCNAQVNVAGPSMCYTPMASSHWGPGAAAGDAKCSTWKIIKTDEEDAALGPFYRIKVLNGKDSNGDARSNRQEANNLCLRADYRNNCQHQTCGQAQDKMILIPVDSSKFEQFPGFKEQPPAETSGQTYLIYNPSQGACIFQNKRHEWPQAFGADPWNREQDGFKPRCYDWEQTADKIAECCMRSLNALRGHGGGFPFWEFVKA